VIPPRLVACVGVALLLGACENGDIPPEPIPTPAVDAQLRQLLSQWGVVPIGEMPVQNAALVALGQALMFDKVLSGNRDISCGTCHQPSLSGTDALSLSIGTGGSGTGASRTLGAGRRFIPRNAPSLLDQGLRSNYIFWDGRVSGFGTGPFTTPAKTGLLPAVPNILAAQAMFPVTNRDEMRGNPGDLDVFGNPNELAQFADTQFVEIWRGVMSRLLAIPAYVNMFTAAFPGTPTTALGFQHAATAIGAFEMQAFTRTDSPFERYLNRQNNALNPAEKRGALIFFSNTRSPRCASCHGGPLLGGGSFADDGVPQIGPGTAKGAPLDFGRAEASSFPSDSFYKFAFRIPPLRNVELTAPYMHDGVFPTLAAVVQHYSDVPTSLRSYDVSQVDPALRASYHGDQATINAILNKLDFRLRTPAIFTEAEKADLVAFLESLTDPSARDMSSIAPASVPSGLPMN
jgi:cytochrome c peroxidase